MRAAVATIVLLGLTGVTAAGPLERWENAVGGRDRVAAITSIYREAAVEYAGYRGTLQVWHTADGKYRKVERVATCSLVETFDGVNGMVKQGDGPPHTMTPAELRLATSRRFANANAMLFAFFPERRHGDVTVESDCVIVLKPEGGVEWRVTLDPATALPATMVHQEGAQTVTVTFDGYETVDGIRFESAIHRSAGAGTPTSSIRFTKTVLNVPIDAALFTIPS